MRTVGLRELKNGLSRYVREVRTGKTVLVSDRGEVVAELRPTTAPEGPLGAYPALVELARQGRLRVGAPPRLGVYPRLPPPARRKPSGAELLDRDRGER